MVVKHREDGSSYDPVPDVFMYCGEVREGKTCNGVMEYFVEKKVLKCKKCGIEYYPYATQKSDEIAAGIERSKYVSAKRQS